MDWCKMYNSEVILPLLVSVGSLRASLQGGNLLDRVDSAFGHRRSRLAMFCTWRSNIISKYKCLDSIANTSINYCTNRVNHQVGLIDMLKASGKSKDSATLLTQPLIGLPQDLQVRHNYFLFELCWLQLSLWFTQLNHCPHFLFFWEVTTDKLIYQRTPCDLMLTDISISSTASCAVTSPTP